MEEIKFAPPKHRKLTADEAHVLNQVSLHYELVLKEHQAAQEFLRRHRLLNKELAMKYRLGVCDRSLPKDHEVKDILKKLGVIGPRSSELLNNYLTIPITREGGKPIALYAHYMYDKKRLMIPEGNCGVFNGSFAKGRETIYVADNVITALNMISEKYPETIAFCGDTIPDEDKCVFESTELKRIYFFLDEEKIAHFVRQLPIRGLEYYKVTLPKEARTLAEYLTGQGKISDLIENAAKVDVAISETETKDGPQSAFQVVSDDDSIRFIRSDLTYRVKGLNARRVGSLKVTIKVENDENYHLDTFDLYSARARAAFSKQVKKVMRLEESRINIDLKEIVDGLEKIQMQMLGDGVQDEGEEMSARDREEALSCLKSKDLIQRILDDAKECAYVGEEKNLLLGYLVSISRKLSSPLALFIISQSGAGKTELQDRVLAFTPPEDTIKLTRLTEQSLFYQGQQSLAHKMIAVEEEEGVTNAGYSIRHLLSSNHLTSMTTIRDEATGKLKAINHKVQGPVSMMITTTNPEINYETYNRFLVVSVDESQEQTRKILEIQRHLETLEGVMAKRKYEKIRKLHQNMQRLIESMEVVNPYAKQLKFLDSMLRARREQKKYHSLIKAIALLRQHQKEVKVGKDGNDTFKYIEVDKEDIETANNLAREFLLRGLDELTPQGRKLIGIIKEMVQGLAEAQKVPVDDVVITRRDIRNYSGWSNYQLRKQINELVQLEYLYPLAGRKGQKYAYKLVWDGGSWTEKDLCLVDAEQL